MDAPRSDLSSPILACSGGEFAAVLRALDVSQIRSQSSATMFACFAMTFAAGFLFMSVLRWQACARLDWLISRRRGGASSRARRR